MIHEPMTMATDYLLSAASGWFAIRLWRAGIRPWGLAFLFSAIGSFAGGTYHGVGPLLHPKVDAGLWKVTVFSIGLASFFLLTGAVVATTDGRVRRGLMLAALLIFIAYGSWMIWHDDFLDVIVDYGLCLLIIAVLQAVAWVKTRDAAAPWVLGSIGLAIFGAIIQQSGFHAHPLFDNNALYHVIQLASLWMLYRGGLLLTMRATGQLTTQPT